MFLLTEHYEKWSDTPIFHCPSGDGHLYIQYAHMKCFAVTLMNSCVMNILVVNTIRLYLAGLLGACALMVLLSPHLIGKIIPIIFIVFAFCLPYIRGNINVRYGFFYMYCLICCMEVQGFEFLFDLYLITCYVVESLYSLYATRRVHVMATLIVEFGMWTLPCSTEFRIGATFGYLAMEAYNYPELWAVSTFYVNIGICLFIGNIYGIDFEYHFKQFKNAVVFLYESFIANATLAVVPEKKRYYKS